MHLAEAGDQAYRSLIPTLRFMKNLPTLAAAMCGLALCSCSTVRFYHQAAAGQWEMLHKAKPVAQVIADPTTRPLLKQKLTTVEHILDYAEHSLQLPAQGQYRRYANLGRKHAVWVVFAAPEFSIQPKTWRYPLVGSLSYRGFFQEKLAEAEAMQLHTQGYDVHVSGVAAYSTLGFFRDPLLNTFIGRDDADLAELIFHELTHQRLYLDGDTDFNEAFATAVGQEGARRWLRSQGRLAELAKYEKELRVEREFVKLILQTREELKACYNHHRQASPEAQRAAKASVLAKLRHRATALDQRHGGSLKIERWFLKPVNNARLSTVSSYYELLPGFESLLQQHGGDLDAFFADIDTLRYLNQKKRRQRLLSSISPP
jgi:predicted aminopeptidase